MGSQASIGWGFVGTGSIAVTLAEDLALMPNNHLAAVASRSRGRARDFGRRHGAPGCRGYDDVAELARDPDVDVVYIATPHPAHASAARVCLEAGTAVLCEKPVTMNAAQARELVSLARARNVFFAEAMWMRCHANVRRALEWVRDGRCGRIGHVSATLGFTVPRDVDRLWNPALGAGALLDLGIYPVTFANLVLGRPASIAAQSRFEHVTGGEVDVSGGATLLYDCGAIATLAWSQTAWCDSRASISGDGGRIEIGAPMTNPPWVDYAFGFDVTRHDESSAGHGYIAQLDEVARCLRAGLTESALLPHQGTLDVLDDLDAIGDLVAENPTEDREPTKLEP